MKTRPAKWLLFLVFMMTVLFWGSSWLGIKYSLDQGMSPFWGTAIRFFFAAVFMLALSLRRLKHYRLTKTDLKLMFYHGFWMTSFSNALVFWGQQYIASNLSSILFAVFPLMVAGFSHFMLADEKLNRTKFFGILVGFSGVVLIFFDPSKMAESINILLGMSAIVLSVLFVTVPTIIIKRDGYEIDPFILNTGGFIIAFFTLLIVAIFVEGSAPPVITKGGLSALVFLGVFPSSLNFVSYFWLIKHVEVSKLSFSAYLTPIVALIVSSLLYNEIIRIQDVIGMLIIFSGIFLSDYKNYMEALGRSFRT